jgi:hypothetical protein
MIEVDRVGSKNFWDPRRQNGLIGEDNTFCF